MEDPFLLRPAVPQYKYITRVLILMEGKLIKRSYQIYCKLRFCSMKSRQHIKNNEHKFMFLHSRAGCLLPHDKSKLMHCWDFRYSVIEVNLVMCSLNKWGYFAIQGSEAVMQELALKGLSYWHPNYRFIPAKFQTLTDLQWK